MSHSVHLVKKLLFAHQDSALYQTARELLERDQTPLTLLPDIACFLEDQMVQTIKTGSSFGLTIGAVLDALPRLCHCSENSRSLYLLEKSILEDSEVSLCYQLTEKDTSLESYLNQALSGTLQLAIHQRAFIISYMMSSYYGLKGAAFDKMAQKEAIQSCFQTMLSTTMYQSHAMIPEKLSIASQSLHGLLHSVDMQERLAGRQICEYFGLPLTLSFMLTLAMDGICSENGKQSIHDAVLVIGETGAGKSTLINYLNNIQFEEKKDLKSRRSRLYMIDDKTRVKRPARIGHSSTSRTIYSQMYVHDAQPDEGEKFGFIDTASFDDSRGNQDSVCASIGTAFAAHYASSLRAVLIVIEWSMFSNCRGQSFRKICQDFNNTFTHIEELFQWDPCPIIFVITKPPALELFEPTAPFDPDVAREAFRYEIQDFINSNKERTAQIEGYLTQKKELVKHLNIQTYCQTAIVTACAYITDAQSSLLTFLTHTMFGSKGLFTQKEIKAYLMSRPCYQNISSECMDLLASRVYTVIRKETPLDEVVTKFEESIKAIQIDLDKVTAKLEQLVSEQNISTLLCDEKTPLFIIRGHTKLAGDRDHRDELLTYLHSLSSFPPRPIPRERFIFDATDKKYLDLMQWVKSSLKTYHVVLDESFELPQMMQVMRSAIEASKEREQYYYGELEALLRFNEAQYLQHLEKTIQFKQEKIADLQVQIQRLEACNQELATKIIAIESRPAIDYLSQSMIYRLSFWRLELSCFWSYVFSSHTHHIPIERVELSCLSQEDKVVVQSDIDPSSDTSSSFLTQCVVSPDLHLRPLYESDKIQITVAEKDRHDLVERGSFIVSSDIDLEKGVFSITYYPDVIFSNYAAAVRVFVKPQYIPRYAEEIKAYRKEIDKNNTLIQCFRDVQTALQADLEKALDLKALGTAPVDVQQAPEGANRLEACLTSAQDKCEILQQCFLRYAYLYLKSMVFLTEHKRTIDTLVCVIQVMQLAESNRDAQLFLKKITQDRHRSESEISPAQQLWQMIPPYLIKDMPLDPPQTLCEGLDVVISLLHEADMKPELRVDLCCEKKSVIEILNLQQVSFFKPFIDLQCMDRSEEETIKIVHEDSAIASDADSALALEDVNAGLTSGEDFLSHYRS